MACAHKIGPVRRLLSGALAPRQVEILLPNDGGKVIVEGPAWWRFGFGGFKVTVCSTPGLPARVESEGPGEYVGSLLTERSGRRPTETRAGLPWKSISDLPDDFSLLEAAAVARQEALNREAVKRQEDRGGGGFDYV